MVGACSLKGAQNGSATNVCATSFSIVLFALDGDALADQVRVRRQLGCPIAVGGFDLRAVQVCTGEVDLIEVGAFQVAAGQIGPGNSHRRQVGARQVDLGEGGAGEVGAG